jgi:glycosyltransferase involved in cell wall biosynthesis
MVGAAVDYEGPTPSMTVSPAERTLAIPCYDVAESLPRTLASVEALDPAPPTVLCIDDGSTDGTKAIIDSHPTAELIEQPHNKGLGATMNAALERTGTPWLAKIDADIVVEPDWLGKLCAHCTETGAALVQGRFEDEVTTTADRWRKEHLRPNFTDEPVYNHAINGSNVLCRVGALRDVGGWNERYRRAYDDIDLLMRLIRAGHTVYYTPDVTTTHTRTDSVRDVLRTSWAYHQDGICSWDDPERPREIALRVPFHAYELARRVKDDVENRNLAMLAISLLTPFYHLKRDVESILGERRRTADRRPEGDASDVRRIERDESGRSPRS